MNFNSPQWKEIAARLELEKDSVMSTLCGDCTHERTLELRGQYKAIAKILNWPELDKAAVTEIGVEFNV